MDSPNPIFDSWAFKVGLLAMLLGARYLLAVRIKPRRPRLAALATTTRECLDSALITLALVFLLIQPFVAQAFWIPTSSMENTLPPQDRILTSKLVYHLGGPKFQDVVVFRAPQAALTLNSQPAGTFYVKRCIGVPGETVEIRNRSLYRNGELVPEPYTRWTEPDAIQSHQFTYDLKVIGGDVYSREYDVAGTPGWWMRNGIVVSGREQDFITAAKPEPVPADQYLMLGDHRNKSSDGHMWGLVPRENILGKAFAVFWPPRHWGLVDSKSQ